MTKKDYERAVALIHRFYHTPKERRLATDVFTEFFLGDNPRFDPSRFRDAAMSGLKGGGGARYDHVHLSKTRGGSQCGASGNESADINLVTCPICIEQHERVVSHHLSRSSAGGGAHKYDVVVGNIGTVYQGRNKAQANNEFASYVRASKATHGRASGESVALFCDGEIEREHFGSNQEE